MKRILTLAFFFFSAVSFAQTIVNQTIAASSLGTPAKYYGYIKGVPLSNDGFALMYDNYLSGLQLDEYTVIVMDSNGNQVGSLEYSSLYPGNNYGTNICAKGQYLYIVGFTMDSTGTNSILCNLLKMDINTADTIWTINASIDSAVTQAPFSVVVDDSGYVYMGASVHTPADYKIEVIKYSPSGQKVWQSSYDTAGLYTVPVAMSLSSGGTALVVTGFSFDGIGHSDFVTVDFTTAAGTVYGVKTSGSGTGVISHPVNIAEDFMSNSYIAGTSTVSGTASVIKLVAYDTAFNQLWMSTWGDSTLTNIASGMTMSLLGLDGNIFVAGSTISATGNHSMVVLRYTLDGTFQWARTINAPNPAYPADGIAIATDGNGNSFVTGSMFNGTDTTVATAGLDSSGNMLWMKNYNRGAGINDVPYGINYASSIGLLVTTRSYGADSFYMGLQYEQFTKSDTTLDSTSAGGKYVADQIIIRFDPSAVNQDAVNNIGVDFASPSYWLTASADSALQANIPFDLSTCTMERIYKGLKTTYKYSIARNGDTIPMPNLWSAFVLIYPDQGKSMEVLVAQSVNTLFPMVTNTNLNYVGTLTGTCYNPDPHPVSCRINDQYFASGSGYGQQNLWDDSLTTGYYTSGSCYPKYNINIDSAWRLETGKPFVKVGIYDTNLDGHDQDFSPNPNLLFPNQSQPNAKANGWDFYTGVSRPSESWGNPSPHGTAVAGFVGAIRNNNIGIAGIAGGDRSIDSTNVGVTLYGMTIVNALTDAVTLPMSDLCNALIVGCTYTDSGYGFGLHVINNSWGIGGIDYATSIPQFSELELAFKTVYKNQTTIVASAGNTALTFNFPANFYNDWILCTGGANDTGGYFNASVTNYSQSAITPCVDVIAPSFSDGINGAYVAATTSTSNTYNFAFFGTSMAAPHVTGTVSLLISYLDSSASVYQNLSPEDAEHLITRSADNKGYIGHSDSTGWGALNAGRTLQSVRKGCEKLLHLGKGDNANVGGEAIAVKVPIKLTERYTNPSGQLFDTITYLCTVIRQDNTMSFSLDSNYVIVDYWTRPSSTNMLLCYDSVHHTLSPFEHLYIDSISGSSVTISGYIYYAYSTTDSSYIGSWGIDSTSNVDSLRFDYTLLVGDTTSACHPVAVIPSGIRQQENSLKVAFHPNPVQDEGELQIFTDENTKATIDIIDQQGRKIETVYSGELAAGSSTFNIDTKALSSGLYFIVISSDDGKKTIKFLKYE